MKFGGTSVGSPQRMNALVNLINDRDPKIVVLSAMSGTTNALVEISQALYSNENEKAGLLIDALEYGYNKVIKDLFQSGQAIQKGKELISNHLRNVQSLPRAN